MRLVTFEAGGRRSVGAVREGRIVDLGDLFPSMLDLIAAGEEGLAAARRRVESAAGGHELAGVRLLAPIPEPRRNVFCVGWNYRAHFLEGKGKRMMDKEELPEFPAFFDKATTAVIGPDDPIPFDSRLSTQLDYEAELAVVIGRGGRSIREAAARVHIFGYTVANDVSWRDLQRRHGGQWLKGKSIDGSCPLGPWIVTADEIPDPQDLDIRLRVNGVLKQDSNTGYMIFPVDRLIAELSLGMTLLPGDILLTGTPEGVGFARTPAEFLRPGDEVEVEVEGVGTLRNRVVEAPLV
ncbi:MAG: fumarylacetoacetate hydrolase family protein [Firmicutes bacterium]|nr:fumarylacetoacetate hydrolase family protein [Bacillota bacterium]